MAQIDKFISMMVQNNYDRGVLTNDKPGTLFSGTAQNPGPIVPGAALQSIVLEITPPNFRGTLTQGGTYRFDYSAPQGVYQIEVTRNDSALQVSISAPGSLRNQSATVPSPQSNGRPQAAGPSLGTEEEEEEYEDEYSDEEDPDAEPTRVIEHLDELFLVMQDIEASDLHVSSEQYPRMRVHGIIKNVPGYCRHTHEMLKKVLYKVCPERNIKEFEGCGDTDFAYDLPGTARFRCNFFMDRHGIGGVFRLIPSNIWSAEDLKLKKAILDLCYLSKGLVVVTGPTGSGKSTTLAAMVDYINRNRNEHIITIEDPIEFVHENIQCLVNQREVHVHTESFKRALRAALREDPDIVLVGEMRDLETIAIAIETAETGHLVFGTLHTTTAPSTVDRIIDQFPADQQAQIRVMLSESLKGIIAQTLLRTVDGKRVAAHEILLIPSSVSNIIREGKTFQLPSMMQIGKAMGMLTMNDSIIEFVKTGRVSPMEAYVKAVDKNGIMESFRVNGIDFDPGVKTEI